MPYLTIISLVAFFITMIVISAIRFDRLTQTQKEENIHLMERINELNSKVERLHREINPHRRLDDVEKFVRTWCSGTKQDACDSLHAVNK